MNEEKKLIDELNKNIEDWKVEPIMKNRFVLDFGDFERFTMINVSKLNFDVIDDKTYWDNITIDLYNCISPNVVYQMFETIKLQKQNNYEAPDAKILLLGPMGDIVMTYRLINPIITGGSLGDFSWENAEPNIITMCVKIDDLKLMKTQGV